MPLSCLQEKCGKTRVVTLCNSEVPVSPGITPICLCNRRFQVFTECNIMGNALDSFFVKNGKNVAVKAFPGCYIMLRQKKTHGSR
jgi:hypothetical protein